MTSDTCTLKEFLQQLNALREAYGRQPLEEDNMRLSLKKAGAWKKVGMQSQKALLDKNQTWAAYEAFMQASGKKMPWVTNEEALSRGLYSVEMLFAACNQLRKIAGIHEFKSTESLMRRLAGRFKPIAGTWHFGTQKQWYEPEPIIAHFTQENIKKGRATKGDYFTANDADINCGLWHPVRIVEKLTGCKKQRIFIAGRDGRIQVLVHPETNDLLYNLKEVERELSFRPLKWLQKVVGEEKASAMSRERETITKAYEKITLVYAPELRHL